MADMTDTANAAGVQFGAQVSAYLTSWDEIRAVAQTMDAGRFDSIWFADHFVPPNRGKDVEGREAFEAFSLAAAVAVATERLRIGHLVLGNTYRNPGLVAKIAGSVDHISHGRFTLGIGASWYRREHAAYGWDYPSMRERQDRFEEACKLLRALIHNDSANESANGGAKVTFDGRYYSLDDAPFSPGSYARPIPMLIGGTGPKRTLRTLALYGDMMNLDGWAGRGMSVELLREKVHILHQHCEDLGRDPAEIQISALMPCLLTDDEAAAKEWEERIGPGTLNGTADKIAQRIGEFIDFGIDEIMFGRRGDNDPDYFQRLDDEVIGQFR